MVLLIIADRTVQTWLVTVHELALVFVYTARMWTNVVTIGSRANKNRTLTGTVHVYIFNNSRICGLL